jgi:hypothetical protein
VNDQLAGALSTLITALATAVLMAAAYYWGPSKRAGRREKREDEYRGREERERLEEE